MVSVSDSYIGGYALAVNSSDLYAEPVTIGRNVVRLRLAAGIKTQDEFARKLGVPQPRASDLENARYKLPALKTLLKAAKVLGCSLDDILEGVDADYDQIRRKRAAPAVAPPAPTIDRETEQVIAAMADPNAAASAAVGPASGSAMAARLDTSARYAAHRRRISARIDSCSEAGSTAQARKVSSCRESWARKTRVVRPLSTTRRSLDIGGKSPTVLCVSSSGGG